MNMDKLQNDLTSLHVMALYDFMCPLDYGTPYTAEQINNRKSMAHKRYLNDPFYHARVNMLVACTVDIIAINHQINLDRANICPNCGQKYPVYCCEHCGKTWPTD